MLEALIPYITTPEHMLIKDLPVLGDLKLQPFGPLVATGVVLGWKQCLKYAKFKNLDEFFVRDYLFAIVVIGFIISHWISVIFYFPQRVQENPMVLLYIWSGLSSVGGFFGATLGAIWYLRKHKQPFMVYGDTTIFGLLLGWCFGRAGCSMVHDHPGQIVPEGTFLAVGPWPDGTWRYDLGLLELMFAITLCTSIYFLSNWKSRRPGWIMGAAAVAYAPFRWYLDSMRATEAAANVISAPDIRYLGMTTAQWFTLAFFLVGLWLLFGRKARDSDNDYMKDSDRVEREAAAKAAAEDSDKDSDKDKDKDNKAESED